MTLKADRLAGSKAAADIMEALHDQKIERVVVAILDELAIIECGLVRVLKRCSSSEPKRPTAPNTPAKGKRILH